MNLRITTIAIALACGLSGAAKAETLRLLSSWDDSYQPVGEIVDPFLRRLEEATDGELTIVRLGPETIPPFEQLDPVARGAFDMLVTNGAYHYNQSAATMSLEALDATSETLRSSGIFDLVDQHYQELGLKLVAFIYDHGGYHIMLKEPIGENLLEGQRIRGTPVYHPVIEALGGSPVVLPGAEIYPALERGVVDGAAWPSIGAVGFRWFEVADYMMRPTFGEVGYPIFMNLDRWNSLSPEMQATIEETAAVYEVEAAKNFEEIVATEQETLNTEGMEVTEVPADVVYTINNAWFDGVMALAEQQNPEMIAQIQQMADEAGLNP